MNINVPYFSSLVTQQCTQWGITRHSTFSTALQLEKEMRLLQLAKIGCVALKVFSTIAVGAIAIVGAVLVQNYLGDFVLALLSFETMSVIAKVATAIFVSFGVVGLSCALIVVGSVISIAGILRLIDGLNVGLDDTIGIKHRQLNIHMNTLQGLANANRELALLMAGEQ